MKRINITLLLLSVICLYAIGQIGFGWFWTIGSSDNADQINQVFINLSYSYITGALVYFLTIALPKYIEDSKLQPVINTKIENIGVMLHNMLVGFYQENDSLDLDIKNITACQALLESADWNQPNSLPIYKKGQNKLCETFKSDFEVIQEDITRFILCYKSHLSTEQIKLLEEIQSAEFYQILSVIVDSRCHIHKEGAKGIAEGFAELLKNYSDLKATIHQ